MDPKPEQRKRRKKGPTDVRRNAACYTSSLDGVEGIPKLGAATMPRSDLWYYSMYVSSNKATKQK